MVLLVGRYGDDGRHIKNRKGVNAQVDCGEEDENGYPLTVKVAIKRAYPVIEVGSQLSDRVCLWEAGALGGGHCLAPSGIDSEARGVGA